MSLIKKISTLFSKKEPGSDSDRKSNHKSKSSSQDRKSHSSQQDRKSHSSQQDRKSHSSQRDRKSSSSQRDRKSNSSHSDHRTRNSSHSDRGRNNRRGVRNYQDQRNNSELSAPELKDAATKSPTAYIGKPFSEMGLHPTLAQKLAELNFVNTTQVQEKSIPITLSGKNIFCSSETGSGKTLSFLLPMLHKLYNKDINQALIICPTREIAIQIQKNITLLADNDVSSALVIGGTNIEQQKQALAQYPQILVATPGRLLDMLSTGMIWLEYTDYVVLDEADRMLDMGFEPDLIKIHDELTGKHQTVLFSATLFPQIKKMAARYADDFQEIVIGNPTRVANSVTHVLVQLNPEEKEEALRYLMSRNRGKMIVFFNTISATSKYSRKLSRVRGARVDAIHSKIDQSKRQSTLEDFRGTETNVLMASDVASRGIDVPNVDLVVNFDIPNNSEEYIHRVGRTGRAGQTGFAISFYTYKDKKKLNDIEKLITGKVKRIQNYRDAI